MSVWIFVFRRYAAAQGEWIYHSRDDEGTRTNDQAGEGMI